MHTSIDLAALEHEMMQYISASAASQGMSDCRQGLVVNIDVQDAVIYGQVGGAEPCRVMLDANRFARNSSCTCAARGWCRHMAAVLYELTGAGKKMKRQTRAEDQPNLPHDPPRPQPDFAPAVWILFFEQALKHSRGQREYPDIYGVSALRLGTVLDLAAEWPAPARQAYTLLAVVYFLSALTSPHDSGAGGVGALYRSWSTESGEIYAVRQLDDALASLTDDKGAHLVGKYATSINALVRTLLEGPGETAPLFISSTYQKIWERLLRNAPGLLDEETARLEALLGSQLDDFRGHPKNKVAQALAYLYVLQGQAGKVRQLYAELKAPARFSAVETFITALTRESPEQFHEWMKWLAPPNGEYNPFMALLCDRWEELLAIRPEAASDYEEYLLANMPYTSQNYRRYLLHTENFRLWADLYMLDGRVPPDIPKDEVRFVEAQSREFLMPLYHHGVELSVQLKNRQAYKTAATLLAKLRAHYRKLNREVEWTRFITQFAKEHSRQPALTEELKKRRII